MKARYIITALLLMVAGLQTVRAQKIILHLPDNQTVEYDISQLDSISFVGFEHMHSYLTCPDDKHPHAIDLGLPSGTKWCCCNVGASTPEGYGGHYAWGETSEKSYYDWNTYAYYHDNNGDSKIQLNEIVSIGSDIAGTPFDVAYVRMGTPWRMPSDAQQRELIDICSRQWTQLNGVNGILVTGPNGGQIFLPPAGGRGNDALDIAGEYGFYWSSSPNPNNNSLASHICVGSGNWYWYWSSDRCYGISVRAVCP